MTLDVKEKEWGLHVDSVGVILKKCVEIINFLRYLLKNDILYLGNKTLGVLYQIAG